MKSTRHNNHTCSPAIRHNQTQSDAITPARPQSDAIRRNHTCSPAIRRTQTHSHLLARLEGASRREDRSALLPIELPGLLDARLLPSGDANGTRVLHARLVVGEVEERDHSDSHQLAICLAISMAIRPGGWRDHSDSHQLAICLAIRMAIRPGGWRGRGEESSGVPPQTATRARGRWREPIDT